MGRAEFEAWIEFYKQNPFDDLHRFHRPAALIAARSGQSAVEIGELMDWLAPEPVPDGLTAADVATMKAFGINPNRRG